MNNLLWIMKIRKPIDEDNNRKDKKICPQKNSYQNHLIIN